MKSNLPGVNVSFERWSKIEDYRLLSAVASLETKAEAFREVGALLNKTTESCRNRYRRIRRKNKVTKHVTPSLATNKVKQVSVRPSAMSSILKHTNLPIQLNGKFTISIVDGRLSISNG